jgi:hypothetical protein
MTEMQFILCEAESNGLIDLKTRNIMLEAYDNMTEKHKVYANFNESMIRNEEDIYYNKEKFDNGETNLCFITGHVGSGKSTMGHHMESDTIETYELDDLYGIKDHFTMDNLREYGNLIYSYFSGKGKKFYVTEKEVISYGWSGAEYEDILYPDFVHYAMQYAKSHKNKKFVLEGVWLFMSGEGGKSLFKPEEFKDYAFYIKGTSAIISHHRASLRDVKNEYPNDKMKIAKNYIKCMTRKHVLKYLKMDERLISKFRNYFTNIMKESVDDLRLSIYESELNGEITVEERVELIEALNEKLNIKE